MPGRLKRTFWVLPLVCAAAFWALWHSRPNTSPAGATSPLAAPATDARPDARLETPNLSNDDTAGARSASEPLDTVALRQHCGRPWEAQFAEECLAVLERRYRGTTPQLPSLVRGFLPVLLGAPATWGQVFDEPAAALAAARDALARPECLVPEGALRIDLRDECAADAMAKLAILRQQCAALRQQYGRLESRRIRWDLGRSRANTVVDQAEYYNRLERTEEQWFAMMWRLHKCRALPEDVLGALGPFPRPLGWRKIVDEEADLMEAAARLGSDWALSSMLSRDRTDRLHVDESEIERVTGERPVLAELLRMRRAQGLDRVKHALVAFRLGDALGVQVHSEGVMWFIGAIGLDDIRAAWRLAAPRLMEQGWTLVVDDPAGDMRRFESPEDLLGDERWLEWEAEDRIRLVAAE